MSFPFRVEALALAHLAFANVRLGRPEAKAEHAQNDDRPGYDRIPDVHQSFLGGFRVAQRPRSDMTRTIVPP
jgi:hypothetical protein